LAFLAGCGSSGRGASNPVTTESTVAPTTVPPTSPPATSPEPSSPTVPPGSTTTASGCFDPSTIATWPLGRRAAELVVAPVLDFDPAVLEVARSAGVGGVVFLGAGAAPADLSSVLASSLDGGINPRPMVMADEEGGGIQRLSGLVVDVPWPRTMAATMTTAEVESLAKTLGTQMRALGVGVDLAPVLDVDGRSGPSSTNPDGLRSFSSDPATAAAYGVAFMQGLEAGGVLSVVKHFPGLGGSTGNTDYGPAATLPWSELRAVGLPPFRAAISAGARAVMVANAYVPGLTGLPASVSPAVITGVLRDQLGFHGLVVTDSLSAGAISAAGLSLPTASADSIEAGADMVLFGSTLNASETAQLTPAGVASSINAIVSAITAAAVSGALPASRLDDALLHVLAASGTRICG
jgi:beta-N-acetylhexosaminidase